MFDDNVFDGEPSNDLPDYNTEKVDDTDIVNDVKKLQFKYGLIEDKGIEYEPCESIIEAIFKNDAESLAILNVEQLADTLNNLFEKGINCERSYLYEFDLSHNEHLIPDKLFFKDNIDWYYDYYMFYKIKKMLHIIFPGVSSLNNLGFYYCKEQHAPLFIVNNTKDTKLCVAIAPEVYDKID